MNTTIQHKMKQYLNISTSDLKVVKCKDSFFFISILAPIAELLMLCFLYRSMIHLDLCLTSSL